MAVPPALYPFVALFAVASVLTAGLAWYGMRFRNELGGDWFVATMALSAAWSVVALGQLLLGTPAVVVSVEVFATFAAIVLPVTWFTFVLEYTGRGASLSRRWHLALWLIPSVALAALFTYPLHDLYWVGSEVVFTGGRPGVEARPGPIAYLVLLYSNALFVAGLWLFVRMLDERGRLFSGQAVWLFLGTLAPVSLALVALFADVPPAVHLIPTGFSVLGLAYAHSLFQHRLFDLVPGTRRIGTATAIEDVSEGVVVLDGDRQIVRINGSACELFDCERELVLGQPIEVLSRDLLDDPPTEGIAEHVRGGDVYEVATSRVTDDRDGTIGHALVVRDVTDLRSREQRLNVLNRILRHNLRNDMTVIHGNAERIAEVEDPTISAMAAMIQSSASDLLSIAEKARTMEQTVSQESVEPASVDVADLVGRIADSMGTEFPDRRIERELPTTLPVSTHGPTLEVVVRNLLENALVHGSPPATDVGARRRVRQSTDGGDPSASPAADRPDVTVRVREAAGGVAIEVVDDGPGVPEDELAVIESGTETDLAHASGLGLWLVQWGVDRLGATVAFETQEGTTARVVLPDAPDRP